MRPAPSGAVFVRQVIGLSFLLSIPSVAIVLVWLLVLLELTPEQWRFFLLSAAAYAVCLGPVQGIWQRRYLVPVATYLDARARGRATDPERRAAFSRVLDMPSFSAIMGFGGWIVPVSCVAAAMALRFEAWSWFQAAVVVAGGAAAGFVAGSFLRYLAKQIAAPVRATLAEELPRPEERAALVRPVYIRTKLLVSVTGVSLVPVVFAVLLFHAMALRGVEDVAVAWGRERLEAGAARSASFDVVTLDVSKAASTPPGVPAEVVAAIRAQLDAGAASGDSRGLASEHVFAWRRAGPERVQIATLIAGVEAFDAGGLWLAFAVLLGIATLVGFLLAHLLSSDVSRATEALRGEVERLAGGDLRRGEVFESEDELGELSRSFEAMAGSLRELVGRVREAADRVEGTAGGMAEVARAVSAVTVDQVRGIEQTTASMEAINGQVRGIADSAQALNVSVEESSSSILELGAAGEELNQTASVLSDRVNEVSGSIEQMVSSVRQVVESTESLSEAAVETSASMGEMATSMREVDGAAEEAARLSREVVGTAESGQAKMVQAIAGMDAIREATETAERVIRGLGDRAREIGAIVDVIDDVADETNLLALNAAIIAAQAGEHGRAFSVVADEIKDLADRTLASTKEIGGLIRAVQEESGRAVGAIERGSASVASGVDVSAEAGMALEEITQASRLSGQRMGGIVSAVREQARAASHVVELMERVRGGVEAIREAAGEQDRGNRVVHAGAVTMREVAAQVRGTTEEQARGSGRIRESVEGVREAVERINEALQEQSAACRSAVEFLEAMHQRTRTNQEAVRRLDGVGQDLLTAAEGLRADLDRFRV